MNDLIPAGLPDLARRINEEHRAVGAALRAGLEHARAAGELLIEAKAKVPYGGWLPWLKANCEVSERTAQAYMRVSRQWEEIEAKAQHVADLTFRDGLELIAEPRGRDGVSSSRDKIAEVAEALGFSSKLEYEQAKAVVEAAGQSPERFAPVVEEMDRMGEVGPAYQKVAAEAPQLAAADGDRDVVPWCRRNGSVYFLAVEVTDPEVLRKINEAATDEETVELLKEAIDAGQARPHEHPEKYKVPIMWADTIARGEEMGYERAAK